MISVISLFLPLCRTVKKLGGGGYGGYDGAYNNSGIKLFNRQPDPAQFTLEQSELLNKMATFQIRRNFPETLYWQPEIRTDHHGRAALRFNVADAITNYRVNVAALTRQGQLANTTSTLRVFQPFFIDFNPPSQATVNDEMAIPAVIYNYLDQPQRIIVALAPTPEVTVTAPLPPQLIPPRGVCRVNLPVKFIRSGTATLRLGAEGQNCRDALEKTIQVQPYGQKYQTAWHGLITSAPCQTEFTLSSQALNDGRACMLTIYPALWAQLSNTVTALLLRPHGCCEQLSSITAINAKIYRYLVALGQSNKPAATTALNYVRLGYQRLLSYENSTGGYAWYPDGNADVILSAKVLQTLSEISKVIEIDNEVVIRLCEWLQQKQLQNGSWNDDLTLTAMIATVLADRPAYAQSCTNAQRYLLDRAQDCRHADPLIWCVRALTANNPVQARRLAEKIYQQRIETPDGKTFWRTSSKGLFFTWGDSGDTELTALAAATLADLNLYPETCLRACLWLQQRKPAGGGWDSTHTSLYAIDAIIRSQRYITAQLPEKFVIQVTCNDRTYNLPFTAADRQSMRRLDLSAAVHDGANRLTVSGPFNCGIAGQLENTYYLPWPATTGTPAAAASPLQLQAGYFPSQLQVGDHTTVKLSMVNHSGSDLPMGIIWIPIPPGLQVITADLEKLQNDHVIDRFTVDANGVVLYCPNFTARRPLLLSFNLLARYPVRCTVDPISAYPYYQPGLMTATRTQTIHIKPSPQPGVPIK